MSPVITTRDFQDFEAMFVDWLDRNQDELDQAGTGNLRDLASMCADWRDKSHKNSISHQETDAAHRHNFDSLAASP